MARHGRSSAAPDAVHEHRNEWAWHLAGSHVDRAKAKPLAVAIPRDVMDVSFAAAWKTLDLVERTQDTIERVLRRELTSIFAYGRRSSRRIAFASRSVARMVRL